MPGERTTHQEVLTLTKRGDQVVCTQRRAPRRRAARATRRTASCARAVVGAIGTALAWDQLGCAAGVANHVVFDPEPGTRSVARWPAAVSAHQSTFITLDLAAAVTSKMLLGAPEDLRERAYTRRRPVAAAGRHRPGLRRAHAPRGDPGQRGPGAARRLPRARSRSATASTAAAPGGWSARRPGTSRRARRPASRSSSSAPRTPTAAAPGLWRGGNSLACGWTPHKVAMAMSAMIWADPSANPVLSLAGGQPGLGGNFLHLGSDAVGKRPRGRRAAGQPRGGRGAGRAPLAPAPEGPAAAAEGRLRRRGVQRLRRLRRPARARPRARRAATSPTARSAASRPSATTAWSSTATPSTAPAPRRGAAAIRAERLDGAAAFGDGERLGTIDRGAVLVPGAAGGVDVAEHAGERRLGLLGVR